MEMALLWVGSSIAGAIVGYWMHKVHGRAIAGGTLVLAAGMGFAYERGQDVVGLRYVEAFEESYEAVQSRASEIYDELFREYRADALSGRTRAPPPVLTAHTFMAPTRHRLQEVVLQQVTRPWSVAYLAMAIAGTLLLLFAARHYHCLLRELHSAATESTPPRDLHQPSPLEAPKVAEGPEPNSASAINRDTA